MYGSPVARRVSTSFWNSERASTLPRSDPSFGLRRMNSAPSRTASMNSSVIEHAVVQVERLAVEVARRLADFEELLDLRVRDVEVAGGRAAAQRALADRQRQAVHHADERDDAAGLAVEADRLADAAHAAPVGADAAALRRQPDILVPGADDAFEAVADAVEIAADRKAAAGAAVGQHRRRRHEPQLRDVIVDALRVVGIVGVSGGDAREQVLIAFARKQIAVAQRVLAELGQQLVALGVGLDLEPRRIDAPCWPARRSPSSSLGTSEPVEKSIALPRPAISPIAAVCSLNLFELGAMPAPKVLWRAFRGFFTPAPCGKRGRV